MDEFRVYLKRRGKKEHVVEGLVRTVERFDMYLEEHRGCDLQSGSPEDIEAFADWLEADKKGTAKKVVRGLGLYYAMTGQDDMKLTANAIREAGIAKNRKVFPVKDFRGVDQEHMQTLEAQGIVNVNQMIEAGRTPAQRQELSQATGIPYETILEYLKLSDLSRVGALKSVRARLYYNAGVDTIDKLAQWDPEALRQMLVEYVERTGFDGIAPLPKEASNAVATAKEIERLVEYE
jgi:hypothetical protein